MFTRKPRLQLEKFAINGAKRLLQHNLPCVDGSELARAFFRFAALVGAAMCSALDAVHMTAGHNALRGSGPGQKPAFDKQCDGTSGLF